MPRLTRERKRELRKLVNKAVAASIRETNLSATLGPAENLTEAERDYASDWRNTLATEMEARANAVNRHETLAEDAR